MAPIELAATAAGAGIVTVNPCKGLIKNGHYLLCFMVAPDQASHEFHRKINMVEEQLETGTQVIKPRIAVGGHEEAVLRALAVAGKAHVAFAAEIRQRVALVQAELQLLRRSEHLEHVCVLDVAQQELWLDEMIAGIQVAVVLNGQAGAAGLV